ncbi:hypothetical protein PVAND_001850 [Polypedilum vanderplanki]|uniref:PH domain-containing protein n=1 Tax=Polypedilum vanderplanki TaxID=319348 RepID=A0A9J6BP78_POLVA|nr:hypothetical protein PVAND_001850 [Polypedilum vanderplanki]
MLSSCLWQLWDWIDPQFATMDSKKLQALQQANSHLAPQTKPPQLQHHDFRPSRSPVFQNYPQYQSLASNFAHINPQEQLLHKAAVQQHQANAQLGYHDQIYQSANAAHHQSRLANHFPGVHQHPTSNLRLQQQFHALEQEKVQQQIRTQNEALIHQQQTFAMRQQMNPPLSNFPSQTSSMSNMSSLNNVPHAMQQQQQQQLNNRTMPPSSLNLSNQYQPAQASPMKINNAIQAQQQQIQMLQNERQMAQQRQLQAVQQQIYHQQQMQFQKQLAQQQQLQQQQTPTDVPMIQQNIPGQVVNQAVQTQLSGMKTTNSSNSIKSPPDSSTTTPSSPATPSTPSHAPLEKRKSEPVHSLKSPVAKRHPNAPVTLSGWLWKQGSEGLKVWRKRWFVLSEYCLFYYKGPEEEKIMGSVLLPSYKISACTPDDKANRKYSFKCEHTNMRTYVLAAETMENMAVWVKALTMAAMMQGSSESESQPSITSSYNNQSVGDNSGDSGIHTFQSQQTKLNSGIGPVTPASDNSGQQQHQPLYANAPPKPRRATDCGYSSPSPENAMDQYGQTRMRQDPIYGYKQQQHQPQTNRSSAKTPDPILMQRMQQMRLEQNKSPSALKQNNTAYPNEHRSALEQEQYMQKLMLHQQQLQQQQKFISNTIPMAYNNERRTPDTYGPSARRNFADYEDIYQLGKAPVMPQIAQQQQPVEMGYRRPLSPTKYDNNIQIPPMPQRYTPNFLEQQASSHQPPMQQISMRNKPSLSVARPHSADFLEYEARNPVTTRMKAEPAQAPRPKSSLDINRSQDNVYYSESNYAEKMRQSASYLQKQSYTVPNKVDHESYFNQDGTTSLHPSMSSQTLQREIDMVRANRYEINDDIHNGSASVPRMRQNGGKNQHLQQQQQLSQQEQFLRSASARLPKKEEDSKLDGERKREESMKRLLEWKQRMLQSPLTRKGPQLSVAPQNTNSLHLPSKSPLTVQNQNNNGYYQSATLDSAQKSNHALQRSRSDTHAISGYGNDDSSDDEDENRVMLAGRSSASTTSTAHNTATTTNVKALKSALKVNNELSVDIEPQIHIENSLNVTGTQSIHNLPSPQVLSNNNNSNKSHNNHNSPINNYNNNNSAYVPVYKHNYSVSHKNTSKLTMELNSKKSSSTIKETEIDNDNNSDADSVIEEKKKLKELVEEEEEEEEENDDMEGQFEYTDNDLDEALLADNNEKSEESFNDVVESVDEEPMTPININAESHYMPMTPKKAILSSSASESSILAMDILNSIRSSTDAIEENPYIEMSSGLSNSSEKQSSNYELVLMTDKKDNCEPLYMELATQNSFSSSHLPPLPIPQQLQKYDNKEKGNSGNKKLSQEHNKTSPHAASNSNATSATVVVSKKRHSDKGPSRVKKRSSHDLPDILKQSQQNYIKSDSSSDADDEDISKEPIVMKSRTRFSLSDTFRPASYYLGASTSSSIHKNVPLAECLDSSDSEIVPPPPIPSTSPPDTEEVFFSSENFNTIKRNSTTSNELIHHQRTMSAGSSQLNDRATNRFSLQDQLYQQQQLQLAPSSASGYLNLPQFEKLKNAKLFSTASNCSINTDDGSNTSSDFDLYNKIKLQSPSISADSLNQSSSSLTDSSPRPRPMLGTADDDAMFKFEEQNANDKLDHYLNKLETSDLFFSKEQTTWLTESLKHTSQQLDTASSLHYENINLMDQQPQIRHTKTNSASLYYDSLEDVSKSFITPQPLKEKNLSIHDALQDDADSNNAQQLDIDESSTIFETTQPSHSRNNSNLSDSAPYYYSDLSGDAMEKLNNQIITKKNSNYISHIQNVINKQQLTSILKDQAEKEQGIDSRNIYESGSGRFGQKFVNKEESTLNDFAHNKIYYHEKNINVDTAAATATGIDNLLYTKNENLDTSTVDCDQLWEEDAIWRESLRRVSQRHARSLDDLDRIESISTSAANKARINDADRQWGVASISTTERKMRGSAIGTPSGSRLSRDVTYVNEEHQRTLTRKNKSQVMNSKLDENDVYVQLACAPPSDADVYEMLRDDSNIDRENIRQWDMMSCGRSSSIGSRSQQQQKGTIISHKAHSSMDSTLADLDLRTKLMKPSSRN